MTRFLITTCVDPNDPRRTQDHAITGRSPWQAGWLFRQLYPHLKPIAIRQAPDHR